MLWNKEEKYIEIPYNKESDLEDAVNEVKNALFLTEATLKRPIPVAIAEPNPTKGLAAALAKAQTVKAEEVKTERQIARETSGVKKM
jgi:hypothetical protein